MAVTIVLNSSRVTHRFFLLQKSIRYRMNKKFLVSILLVVLLGAGAWFWMKPAAPAAIAPTETPVPVTVQTARFSDFDDFVVGLGSVQAFNTVIRVN